jgi:hypothetical protein
MLCGLPFKSARVVCPHSRASHCCAANDLLPLGRFQIAVEINMPEPGVISGHLFSVDDTVEVGQDLFQYVAGNVDVSKLPPPPAAPVAAEKVAPAPVVAAPKADASHSVRSPSMRFPPRVPLELRMPMSLALARHKLGELQRGSRLTIGFFIPCATLPHPPRQFSNTI